MKTQVEIMRESWSAHNLSAEVAYELYARLCAGAPPPRVPGMDTVLRLAIRIGAGHTAQEAALAEYLYRWRLAIGRADETSHPWRVFGAPHLLGA